MFKKLIDTVKNFFNKFKKEESFEAQASLQTAGAPPRTEIKYYLNDPSTPQLVATAINPTTYKLPFTVKHFMGSGGPFDRPQGQAANVYAVLCHSINVVNKKTELNKWALVKSLTVDPLAGDMPNAYYDRQNLKFFYFNGKSGKKVYTCLSADIISHELGHAILDAMRPEYFNMASTEIWAFHESFGDCISIFSSLSQPAMVDYIMKETGGDLKKSNLIEGLAEQFGSELGLSGALRKAVNNFVYVNPANLPKNAPDNQLSSEVHSFSRVMTAAFYDILCAVYSHFGGTVDALAKAREFLLTTYIEANKKAPASANFFQSFAATWISVTQAKDPQIANIMKVIFKNRQIYGAMIAQSFSGESQYPLIKTLTQVHRTEDVEITMHDGKVKAADLFADGMHALSDKMHDIMTLNLSVPVDEMLSNEDGIVTQMCMSSNQACECAKDFISYLLDNDLYGPEDAQPWYKDGEDNLVRKHITCCGDNGFINNCKVPGNPEFGKCWKCKNNTGCCTYGSCGCEEPPKRQVVLPCRTRYNSCSVRTYNASCGGSRYNNQNYGYNSAQSNTVPYT